jgi:hypothetical protein
MAYHFANQNLSAVQGIDELDSCAYTVLAALFSKVEEDLLGTQRAAYLRSAQKKPKDSLGKLWDEIDVARRETGDVFTAATLGKVLQLFAKGKIPDWCRRISINEKFRVLWLNAVQGPRGEFAAACATLLAHLDLADMPGNQCTAVVRGQDRVLYVTGNGLWSSGNELEQNVDGELSPDSPWFSSEQACQQALLTIADDLQGEYNLTDVEFVIPTEGDMGGKFHAEMQLLEYMLDNEIMPERGYMGVSKPCCQFCGGNLAAAGIAFWTGHGIRGNDPNPSVNELYDSYKNPMKIAAFQKAVRQVPFYGVHG